MQIPGTRSQLCRVTCQQPQGDMQSKTNLSCLWQHQKTTAVPWGQRRACGLYTDTKGLNLYLTPLPSVPGLQLTAHLFCWRLGSQSCKTGKKQQKGLSGWWRGPDPVWWECGLNGCCYHRGISQSYYSTYCLEKKSWLLVLRKASLCEKLVLHWSTKRAHQLAVAKGTLEVTNTIFFLN